MARTDDGMLEVEGDSVLKTLAGHPELIEIEKTERGYKITECRDYYMDVTLTETQFRQLIEEMTALLPREAPQTSQTQA